MDGPPEVYVKVALFVLSLGLDTFIVAVGLGLAGTKSAKPLTVSISFAAFEGLMPLIGLFAGSLAGALIGNAASVLGILILLAVGAWSIFEGLSESHTRVLDLASWGGLAAASLSVSLDELAVGFSMGALGLPVLLTIVLIAAQAFALTLAGFTLGKRMGDRLVERGELISGAVLCGLGLLLLLEKLLR